MNFLFFDTECAHGRGGICEFGYILTDENFNVIKSDNLLINPHTRFDDYGHKKAGIIFAYSKDEYYAAPDIMDRYDEIKSLLTDENNVVVGFATDSDANFILNDLENFDLPYINFVFWDVLKMYKVIAGRTSNLKLEILYSETGLESLMHHEALSDTVMTIKVMEKLLKDYNLSAQDVLEKYKETSGEVFNGRIVFNDGSIFNYTKGGRTTAKNRRLLDDVIKNGPIGRLSNDFEGKIFSVAPNIAKENFALTMGVCNAVNERSGEFTLSVCDANYLLVDKDSKIPKQRLRRGVKLLSIEEFEKLLGKKEGELGEENINIDEILGSLPDNEEWYKEYKTAHG